MERGRSREALEGPAASPPGGGALHLKYWHTATPHLTFITDDDGETTQSSGIERLSVLCMKTWLRGVGAPQNSVFSGSGRKRIFFSRGCLFSVHFVFSVP